MRRDAKTLASGLARALDCRERAASKENEADLDALDKLVLAENTQTYESIERRQPRPERANKCVLS